VRASGGSPLDGSQCMCARVVWLVHCNVNEHPITTPRLTFGRWGRACGVCAHTRVCMCINFECRPWHWSRVGTPV
jgi:hypothetical protein